MLGCTRVCLLLAPFDDTRSRQCVPYNERAVSELNDDHYTVHVVASLGAGAFLESPAFGRVIVFERGPVDEVLLYARSQNFTERCCSMCPEASPQDRSGF